jgi:hypothetical protein
MVILIKVVVPAVAQVNQLLVQVTLVEVALADQVL